MQCSVWTWSWKWLNWQQVRQWILAPPQMLVSLLDNDSRYQISKIVSYCWYNYHKSKTYFLLLMEQPSWIAKLGLLKVNQCWIPIFWWCRRLLAQKFRFPNLDGIHHFLGFAFLFPARYARLGSFLSDDTAVCKVLFFTHVPFEII